MKKLFIATSLISGTVLGATYSPPNRVTINQGIQSAPLNEVIYGTGTSVTSKTNFTYKDSNKELKVGSVAVREWDGSANYSALYFNPTNTANYSILGGKAGQDKNLYLNTETGAGVRIRSNNSLDKAIFDDTSIVFNGTNGAKQSIGTEVTAHDNEQQFINSRKGGTLATHINYNGTPNLDTFIRAGKVAGNVNIADANTGNVTLANGGGKVGVGVGVPTAKLEVQDKQAIKIGLAHLSSGGAYTHLANGEYFDGGAWIKSTPNNTGALFQQEGQNTNIYKFSSTGVHDNILSASATDNRKLFGTVSNNGTVVAHGDLHANGVLTYGNAGTRTETLHNPGANTRQSNATNGISMSGFFETSAPIGKWYPNANSWQHLIQSVHSNPDNLYRMQIAGGFFGNDMWYRNTNNNANQQWRRVSSDHKTFAIQATNLDNSQGIYTRVLLYNGGVKTLTLPTCNADWQGFEIKVQSHVSTTVRVTNQFQNPNSSIQTDIPQSSSRTLTCGDGLYRVMGN